MLPHFPLGGNHWSTAASSTHLHFQWRMPGLPAATVHTWQCCRIQTCENTLVKKKRLLIPACVPLTLTPIMISEKAFSVSQEAQSYRGPIKMPSCTFQSCWYLAQFCLTQTVSMKQYVEISTWDGSQKSVFKYQEACKLASLEVLHPVNTT